MATCGCDKCRRDPRAGASEAEAAAIPPPGRPKKPPRGARRRSHAGALRPRLPEIGRLREDDLDAAVLRLAHAVGGRDAVVVFAASADGHLLPRHAQAGQSVGDVVGAPLGEPLVVPRRTRPVGIAGNLDRDRAAGRNAAAACWIIACPQA